MADLGLDRLPYLADIQDTTRLGPFDEISQDPLLGFIAEVTPTAASSSRSIHQAGDTLSKELRMQTAYGRHRQAHHDGDPLRG